VFSFEIQSRPIWLSALLGAAFGGAAQLLVVALGEASVAGPLATLLLPAIVGFVAAVVVRAGWGAAGLAVGAILAAQVAAPAITATVPPILDLVLSLVSSLLGYAVGFGWIQQAAMPDFRPPPLADIARVEADVRLQLRSIDPSAPGAFERATVLLRKVNEQTGMYGMWSGPKPANEPIGPPSGLLELQAELVETARLAAIAAGARRVTITSSGIGGGIDIQAVFGDPIGPDEPLPSATHDVD
jgi:hypothetical protein